MSYRIQYEVDGKQVYVHRDGGSRYVEAGTGDEQFAKTWKTRAGALRYLEKWLWSRGLVVEIDLQPLGLEVEVKALPV